MNSNKFLVSRLGGTATALLLAFLLFYFPSVLSLFSRGGEPLAWSVTGVVMATFYTVVFCVNYFMLVPWLLSHPEKRSLYFLINLGLIVGICFLIPLWFELTGGFPFPKGRKHHEEWTCGQYILGYLRFVMRDSIMMILAAALGYALRLSEAREQLRRRELEMSAEQRQLELKSLKAQLNPHFLFNSLNNIYALIGFAPDRAQTALHDLSSMLRFMIYESGSSAVALGKELQFINDYTALMRLRLNSNIRVECNVMEFPPSDVMVTPLIFLTLVENAFKHVAPLPDGTGFIRIDIRIDSAQAHGYAHGAVATQATDSTRGIVSPSLVGTVSNTYTESSPSTTTGNTSVSRSSEKTFDSHRTSIDPSGTRASEESGVGLENVKKQLQLIYPNSHKFEITQENNIFTAALSIPLSSLRQTPSPTPKDSDVKEA